MERRALLSAVGAGAAALAGCTDRLPGGGDDGGAGTDDSGDGGGGDDGDPTGSPTTAPDERRVAMGEAAIVDKERFLLENPRVHPTMVRDFGAWQGLKLATGQFVVVDVTTGGPVPDHRRDLGLASAVGGEPLEDSGPLLVAENGAGGPFDPAEWDRQPVAFPFPAERHDRASIAWENGGTTVHWPLDESVRTAVATPPTFRLAELGVERVAGDTGDGAVELRLAVANEGPRAARFQAQVSFEAIHDASSIVQFEVPAGETVGYRDVPPILEYQGVETVTVDFPAGGEHRQRKLDLAPATATPTPTGSRETATGTRETETATAPVTSSDGTAE